MSHPLFQPYDLKGMHLQNRVVMAPLTRCRAGLGDTPTALMADYYAQRAGAGLIISEGTPVSDTAHGYLWTPGIYTAQQIEGWRQVASQVQNAGGCMFVQIWHVGRISHTSLQPDQAAPLAPSETWSPEAMCFAWDPDGNPGYVQTSPPQALDQAGIDRLREAFVQAAQNAVDAGMDGVEIHGANGYLFDQFLNSQLNQRSDAYGGSVENRCRFLLETVDAVAQAIGPERVGVRISPNGRFNEMPEDPEMEATFLYLAGELARHNMAYLHVNDKDGGGLPDGMLAKLRSAFFGTLIVCGGYDAVRAKQVIDDGLADMVAFGTLFIANPDLPARLENGWPLNEADPNTFYGGAEQGYTDYPFYQG